ncbi:MAG: DUF3857 domain-containing protein [Bryobacteraceae bacterium]
MLRKLLSIAALALLATAPVLRADWRPVSPAELALKQSASDPNADAEALFRDVRLLNEAATFGYPHNVITEYFRLKIFTTRGVDKYGNVRIPYWGKTIVSGVAGRTIKPDGTIVDLTKDAIFDKVIVRDNGVKVKVVSFAMPGVGPGAIIEYRFTKNIGEFIDRYVPLDVQSEFPIDELTFHIKPVRGQWAQWPAMRYMPVGCNIDNTGSEAGGFVFLTLHNIPAFHEEPRMPPEYAAKQWILLYYEENTNSGKDKYWNSLARGMYNEYSSKLKVNGDVRDIAQELTNGAASDDDKIARLLEYCRKNLKDIHGREITTEERDGAKANHTTADTLQRKEGSEEDIKLAFIALATAAGFDAKMARLADRGTFFFNPNFQSAFFLNAADVAVKMNGGWKFYDVTNRNLPPGQLRWQEQGVLALVTDPKDPQFVRTPLLNASQSSLTRIADLKLSAEGLLEGDIREIYLGNKAVEWRERFGSANDAEREDALREHLKHRFADFELSAPRFAASPDASKGVSVVYHVTVQNYAQRTGKRLFVLPDYFEVGSGAPFTDSTRRYPIYFDYAWSENDSVELQLPEGFAVDHGDSPQGLKFPPVGNYAISIGVSKANKIVYHRSFTFGGDSVPMFDAKFYPSVKQIFDKVHDGDNHMLTLKAEAPASASVQ